MPMKKLKSIKKKMPLVFCLLALCATSLWACNPDDNPKPAVKDQPVVDQPVHDSLPQNDNTKTMRVRITIGDKSVVATMYDNATAKDFISMLPLALQLDDYNGTEKISYLSRKLTTAGAPSGSDPEVGDISYFAPWGNLAIYYKDFGYSSGLIKFGKIEGDVSILSSSQKLNATFEKLE